MLPKCVIQDVTSYFFNLRIISLILIVCVFSSCAIHHEFPFICFASGCVKQQFSMKPLKKRMQAAMGRKKRKFKASIASSKNDKKKPSYSKNYNPKTTSPTDSLIKDSTIVAENPSGGSLAVLDTVVRIYYQDLTDSAFNKHKVFIKSFIKRIGVKHISEISLTDYYSVEGHDSKSIKGGIANYIINTGVSKHRLFWRKNKRLKLDDLIKKLKSLLFIEIRFH